MTIMIKHQCLGAVWLGCRRYWNTPITGAIALTAYPLTSKDVA